MKANLGHLEATAGLAGLLKAIVVLNTGSVPPQINFKEAKLALELEKRHIHVSPSLATGLVSCNH